MQYIFVGPEMWEEMEVEMANRWRRGKEILKVMLDEYLRIWFEEEIGNAMATRFQKPADFCWRKMTMFPLYP